MLERHRARRLSCSLLYDFASFCFEHITLHVKVKIHAAFRASLCNRIKSTLTKAGTLHCERESKRAQPAA